MAQDFVLYLYFTITFFTCEQYPIDPNLTMHILHTLRDGLIQDKNQKYFLIAIDPLYLEKQKRRNQ